MTQHINFLKSFPKAPLRLPAKWITLATVASVALLTLISLTKEIYQISHYQTIKQIHTDNTLATIQFQNIAKTYPLLASDIPLAIQITTLENELEKKKHDYATLTRASLRHGFSNYLTTLAQVVPEGLWLNKIFINQETKQMSLGGYMIKPVDVSRLLQALQDSPAFASTTFNLFYVKEMPGKPYTAFILRAGTK